MNVAVPVVVTPSPTAPRSVWVDGSAGRQMLAQIEDGALRVHISGPVGVLIAWANGPLHQVRLVPPGNLTAAEVQFRAAHLGLTRDEYVALRDALLAHGAALEAA